MKVQHKNSKEDFDLSVPSYTKLNGIYGYLVMGFKSVWFISDGDNNLREVTEDFNILN